MNASTGRPGSTRRHAVLGAVVAIVVLIATACSIGADDEPRALTVSTTTTSTPAAPTSGGASAELWYVSDGALVPVSLSLPDHLLSTVVGAMFDAPDQTVEAQDLTTSIPVDTSLRSVDLVDGTLTIDLSEEFDNVIGPSRQQAIAQIVLTATDFSNVSRVRFQVDGTPIQVATPTRGDAATVTACDYVSLLADPVELSQGVTDDTMIVGLQERIAELEETCPAPD